MVRADRHGIQPITGLHGPIVFYSIDWALVFVRKTQARAKSAANVCFSKCGKTTFN